MDFMEIIRLLFIYVVAITIHEYSHAAMAHWLGDPTARQEGRLTLNPVAHIDPVATLALPIILILVGSPVIFGAAKPVPFNPYMVRWGRKGAALVAFAGPGSNLVLAFLVAIVLRLFPGLILAGNQLLANLMVINIALALFNLIPIPPLDGSRIVYAFVPDKVQDAMERFERMGMLPLLIVFIVIFPLISPYLGALVQGITKLFLGIS